jgi:uncharacterized protein (TIGR03000 family)
LYGRGWYGNRWWGGRYGWGWPAYYSSYVNYWPSYTSLYTTPSVMDYYTPDVDYYTPDVVDYSGDYTPPSYYTTPSYTYAPTEVDVQQAAPATTEAPPQDNCAHLLFHVPADAQLWFNGTATSQAGTDREFYSPPLTPGRTYHYNVRARWTQDGRPVEVARDVPVQANEWKEVDLTAPATAPGNATEASPSNMETAPLPPATRSTPPREDRNATPPPPVPTTRPPQRPPDDR